MLKTSLYTYSLIGLLGTVAAGKVCEKKLVKGVQSRCLKVEWLQRSCKVFVSIIASFKLIIFCFIKSNKVFQNIQSMPDLFWYQLSADQQGKNLSTRSQHLLHGYFYQLHCPPPNWALIGLPCTLSVADILSGVEEEENTPMLYGTQKQSVQGILPLLGFLACVSTP